MAYHLRRLAIAAAAALGTVIFLLWFLPRALNPVKPSREKQEADRLWVDTSPEWLDRQACRWLSLCGVAHVREDPPEGRKKKQLRRPLGDGIDEEMGGGGDGGDGEETDYDRYWRVDRVELKRRSGSISESGRRGDLEEQRMEREEDGEGDLVIEVPISPSPGDPATAGQDSKLRGIPQYVLDHAPLVHLYSGEHFWPTDIAEHVRHMTPRSSGYGKKIIDNNDSNDNNITTDNPLSLDNLGDLDGLAREVFLTSDQDVEDRPAWLHSEDNVPLFSSFYSQEDGTGNDDAGNREEHWIGVDVDMDDIMEEEEAEHDGGGPRLVSSSPSSAASSLYPAEGTTWFDADQAHPLNSISDPGKKPAGVRPGSLLVPSPTSPSARRRSKIRRLSRQDDSDHHDPDSKQMKRSRVFPSDYPSPPPLPHQQHQKLQNTDNKPDSSGYSRAPATLILVDKGSGVVDAFWFFFYAYNLGQTVLGVRYGNHVGDWEHAMVRFESGVPTAVYLSEHEGGQAYAWEAVEKKKKKKDFVSGDSRGRERRNDTAAVDDVNVDGDDDNNTTSRQGPAGTKRGVPRPVIYSAVGSHAMYASPADHPYVLPFNVLRDVTDRGPLWDPAQNLRSYWYDYTYKEPSPPTSTEDQDQLEDDDGTHPHQHSNSSNSSTTHSDTYTTGSSSSSGSLVPTAENPTAPTSWFHFRGRWGDEVYRLDDERQYRLFGQYHYVTGPQGPKAKNLGRSKVCQAEGEGRRCRLLRSIEEGRRSSWHS